MTDLFWTILSLSLAGSLLGLAAFAWGRFGKGRPSRSVCYYLWLVVLVRLVLPFGLPGSAADVLPHPVAAVRNLSRETNTVQTNPENIQPPKTEPAAAQPITIGTETPPAAAPTEPLPSAAETETETAPTAPPAAGPSLSQWLPAVLPWVWMAGVVISLGWFLLSYGRFFRSLLKTSQPVPPQEQAVLDRLNPGGRVALLYNPNVPTPMLIGLRRPCIVIPQESYGAELEYILRHELTHFRRHDLLYKWFVVAATAVHWFNPLMILFRREIARACELACDEGAIRELPLAERRRYGQTLLAQAAGGRLPASALATTLSGSKQELKERLLGVLEPRTKTRGMAALAVVLAIGLTSCGAVLGPAAPSGGESGGDASVSNSRDPWLAGTEEDVTRGFPWIEDTGAFPENEQWGDEEFTMDVSLPVEDMSYPAEPWDIGLDYYEDSWTKDSPYTRWNITRQQAEDNVGIAWMTVETWQYRGLFRVTLLTDLRSKAVWEGKEPTPSEIYSLSTIESACRTHRGIGVGSTVEELQAAYPEAYPTYQRTDNDAAWEAGNRGAGIVDHDTCWRFSPGSVPEDFETGATILFLTKGDRIVQVEITCESDGSPRGLGYYLDDWAYNAAYLT